MDENPLISKRPSVPHGLYGIKAPICLFGNQNPFERSPAVTWHVRLICSSAKESMAMASPITIAEFNGTMAMMEEIGIVMRLPPPWTTEKYLRCKSRGCKRSHHTRARPRPKKKNTKIGSSFINLSSEGINISSSTGVFATITTV